MKNFAFNSPRKVALPFIGKINEQSIILGLTFFDCSINLRVKF